MSTTSERGNEGAGQAVEQNERADAGVVDEDGFEVIDEARERMEALRPSVEMETRALIDTDNPEARGRGLTLEEEELIDGWAFEIERTVERWDRRQESDREARTRTVASEQAVSKREAFDERAASVNPGFDAVDPRARLGREELAAVNREAARLEAGLANGTARAALARQLAERVIQGRSLLSASLAVVEAEQTRPERVVEIARIGEVPAGVVNIRGEVTRLYEPSTRSIQQVGLIEDESGTTKFTVWRRSNQPVVRVGDEVVFKEAAKNWFNGRVSVALTGWSEIEVVGGRPGGR